MNRRGDGAFLGAKGRGALLERKEKCLGERLFGEKPGARKDDHARRRRHLQKLAHILLPASLSAYRQSAWGSRQPSRPGSSSSTGLQAGNGGGGGRPPRKRNWNRK